MLISNELSRIMFSSTMTMLLELMLLMYDLEFWIYSLGSCFYMEIIYSQDSVSGAHSYFIKIIYLDNGILSSLSREEQPLSCRGLT